MDRLRLAKRGISRHNALTTLAVQSTKALVFVQQGALVRVDFSLVATFGVVMALGFLLLKLPLSKTKSRSFEIIVDCLSVVAGTWLILSDLLHLR